MMNMGAMCKCLLKGLGCASVPACQQGCHNRMFACSQPMENPLHWVSAGLCSVVFAKSTQISVRAGQRVCATILSLDFGTPAEATVCCRHCFSGVGVVSVNTELK